MTYLSKLGGVAVSALCALAFAASIAAAVAPNVAYAAQPVDATVPVEVAISGDAAEAQDFAFVMQAAQDETVLPDAQRVSINGAGSAQFTLCFNQVGEHHYTVRQVIGTAEGWTYDETVYDVTVFAMWNQRNDTLFSTVVVYTPEGKAEACSFTNSYAAPAASVPSQPEKASSGVKTGDNLMLVALGIGAVAVVAIAAGAVAYRRARKN